MAGSAEIGNLAVNLSLETAAFVTGAAKARGQAEGLKGSLAGLGASMKSFAGGLVGGLGIGLVTAGLAEAANNAFAMGSALTDASQKMGVTVEALQELNLAATQSGVSQESLAGAMAKLNKNMGLLEQGSKPAVAAFAKLGLSAEDLKNKSPDEVLRVIADRLNKIPDVQQRVAIGAQLMGRGFSELLPLINEGSKGLDDYAQKQRAQGEITTEEAKQLHDLENSWNRLKITVGVATAKILAAMADYVEKADAWTARWYAMRDGFISSAEQMATGVVSAIRGMVAGVGSEITGRLNAIWEGAKKKIDGVREKFRQMYDDVVGHSYVPDMVQEIGASMAGLQRVMVDPAATAADKVGSIFQSLQGVIGRIFGGKGGILEIIGQLAQTLVPLLFPSAKPGPITQTGATTGGGNYVGSPLTFAASGASGVFGGYGGVDSNLLSLNGAPMMRVSKGENFHVVPANQNGSGKLIVELRDEMLDARISNGADVRIVRAYPAIRGGAMEAISERGRRR